MFIVFEGADGSGKSTQARLLAERLRAELPDRRVLLTREPGGSPGAEEIRALLISGSADRWSAETELLLFNAARRDHVERTVLPALRSGAIVICDRFVGSTIAYQGARSPELARKAALLHDEMIGVNPDLTILLERPGADSSVAARGRDRMEEAQSVFMGRTRRMFGELLAGDPSWAGVFAADKGLIAETVFDRAMARISGGRPVNGERVVMDEAYLASLGPFSGHERIGRAPDPFYPHVCVDRIVMSRPADPFPARVEIERDDVGPRGMRFSVCGVPAAFAGISIEQANVRALERIEADLPDLMAELSGYDPEPGCAP